MTEKVSIVTLALAAGAAAELGPNLMTVPITERPLHDAYHTLRATLQEHYPSIEVTLLDIAPGSELRRQEMDLQIRQSGALEDDTVLMQVGALLGQIIEHAPEAAAAVGITYMPGAGESESPR